MGAQNNPQQIKSAASVALVVASVLLLAKLFVWLISDSTSVLSSSLDSLMDMAASMINFIAIRYALMPADDNHPFGHAKAEALAALLQAVFICGSVFIMLAHVVERFLHPQALTAVPHSMAVMLFATVLTLLLVAYQRHVYRQTGSLAIKADSEHYRSDLLINLAVMMALAGAYINWLWLDPVIALVIVLLLLHSVYKIVRLALAVLLDESLDKEQEQAITQIVMAQRDVKGLHHLKTRHSGRIPFIQLHLELDANQPLFQAHAVSERVACALREYLPQAEIIIHHDPV